MATVVGCSDASIVKWDRFSRLVEPHIHVVKSIIARKKWASPKYHYIDFYAGPGIYTEKHSAKFAGFKGSPLIAADAAELQGVPMRAVLFEKNVDEDLRGAVFDRQGETEFIICHRACQDGLDAMEKAVPRNAYGLAFVDPNGVPPWDAVQAFARMRPKIDILININAANQKFCRISRLHPETMTATGRVRTIKARSDATIMLWAPAPSDPHQFAFAYITNGPPFKGLGRGWHHIDSPCGRQIADRIDFSSEERKARACDFLPGFGGLA